MKVENALEGLKNIWCSAWVSRVLPHLLLVPLAFEVFGMVVVCPAELSPDSTVMNTPAVAAGIEGLETYFPESH